MPIRYEMQRTVNKCRRYSFNEVAEGNQVNAEILLKYFIKSRVYASQIRKSKDSKSM